MQQRADRSDGPVGEATVRIPLGEPTSTKSPATSSSADATAVIRVPDKDATTIMELSPNHTSIIPVVDPDATTKLEVGDNTVLIPLAPNDSSETRFMPAPVITTNRAADPAPAAVEVTADHRPEFALAGFAAALFGIAGLFVPGDAARLVLLLILVVVGPGAVLLSVANIGNRLISWALTVAGSLTIVLGFAVVTLWTHIWQPTVTLGVLAGATLIGSVAQFTRLTKAGVPLNLGRVGPPFDTVDNGLLMAAVPFVSLVAGVGLWIVSLARLDPGQVSLYGFSASLGAPFIVGTLLLMIGFSVELFGRCRPAVTAAFLVVVPVIMQSTVPLLDGTIEYAWTYKHIGVVDLLQENGHLLSSSDIYQQWPGFFAVIAMLTHVSGLNALSFAAWSSLFFALANSLMTAALLRQFTKDRRIITLGVLIVQIAMWVDIGYFSPQAYVYTLMLAFWIVVCRWLIRVPVIDGVPTGKIARLRAWLLRDMPTGIETDRRTRLWAGLAAAGIFAAITIAHQLTPYMMLVPIFAFAVVGILRPRWLLAGGLVVVALAFVAPRLASINSQYSIFSLDFLHNASGNADTWGTPEQEFSALVARTLAIGVWLVALITMFLSRKRLGRVIVPAALGFLPMATLVAGNYGGEAIYRVFAFSLPFCALLIGAFWIGRRARKGVPAMLISGVLLAAMMLAGLQGLQGQLYVHQVRTTDITAAEYFYAHAQPDSALVLVAPNFPTKLTGNYGSFNRGHVSVDISLVGDPVFTGSLNASRLPDVETYIRAMAYKTNYLVVSEAMADYTDYFGTEPVGTMASLEAAMRASRNWTVFYQGPGVTIFQLNPA